MTIVKKAVNHDTFTPMQTLYNLINTTVQDINSIRANKTTTKERQWIYPEEPLSNDELYPRIALKIGTLRFEEFGSGQYINTTYNISNQATSVNYAKVAILPVTVVVFIKKNQSHTVEYYNGTSHKLKNSKQADYLGFKIAKYLEMYRPEYFIPENMEIKITDVSPTYNNNDYTIAKNITTEISLLSEWKIDLTDPASTVGIIENINLEIDVDRV